MGELELSVGLDLYVTETTALCDYVLPVTTMYERDDGLLFQPFHVTPFRQVTEAVAEPRSQTRSEWQIVDDLMSRMPWHTPGVRGGLGPAFGGRACRPQTQPAAVG